MQANRRRGWLKTALWWASVAVALVVAQVLAEVLTPVQAFDTYLAEHEDVAQGLLVGTIAMALVGAAILALAQFLPAPRLPAGMSDEEVAARVPPLRFGEASGRRSPAFSGEASFAAVKDGWRLRAWRYGRPWRILFVMAGGAILAFFGIFGMLIVVSPPALKILCAGVVLYVLARMSWAFSRA